MIAVVPLLGLGSDQVQKVNSTRNSDVRFHADVIKGDAVRTTESKLLAYKHGDLRNALRARIVGVVAGQRPTKVTCGLLLDGSRTRNWTAIDRNRLLASIIIVVCMQQSS